MHAQDKQPNPIQTSHFAITAQYVNRQSSLGQRRQGFITQADTCQSKRSASCRFDSIDISYDSRMNGLTRNVQGGGRRLISIDRSIERARYHFCERKKGNCYATRARGGRDDHKRKGDKDEDEEDDGRNGKRERGMIESNFDDPLSRVDERGKWRCEQDDPWRPGPLLQSHG